MNTNTFLTCLGYYGVSTGTSAVLEGVYSSTSGTTGYIYNQLYATGLHQSGSVIFGPVLPLINVGRTQFTGNTFTGSQSLRAGYKHSGNFSVLMDVEYSGCARQNLGVYYTLLSTAETSSGLASGFSILVNDANRLVFKTLNNNATLTKELNIRDMVYVGMTENQYVTFGIYSLKDQNFYSQTVALDTPLLNTESIYLGGHLSYSGLNTGFFGRINTVMLFNDDIANVDVGTCAKCSLATGYNVSNVTNNYSGYQITGVYYSGVITSGVTGLSYLTGQVRKADGSFLTVYYSSGISGATVTGEVALPMLGNATIQTTGLAYNFGYDQTALNTMLASQILFDVPLTSGDVVEIYSYQAYNPNIGKLITSTIWPSDTGVIQIVNNGLTETSGVDFYVSHNSMSGFNEEDVLSYDVLSGMQVVTAYSGYWYGSRTLMSGGSYFPAAPQYYEETGASNSGQVKITGLPLVCTGNPYYPRFGYDVHLNGQKLVSGLQYDVTTSGASGFVVILSGSNLPNVYAEFLYDITGGNPTGVASYDDNELSFLPQFSGFSRARYDITGTMTNVGTVTGYSEQVWVNGLRQLKNLDYVLRNQCEFFSSGSAAPSLTSLMYDSQSDTIGKWNYITM